MKIKALPAEVVAGILFIYAGPWKENFEYFTLFFRQPAAKLRFTALLRGWNLQKPRNLRSLELSYQAWLAGSGWRIVRGMPCRTMAVSANLPLAVGTGCALPAAKIIGDMFPYGSALGKLKCLRVK